MNEFENEQEAFWAGSFGSEYISRNSSDRLLAANVSLFSKALARTAPIRNCIEFGANIGMNLRALQVLYPEQEQHAVEINPDAAGRLREVIPARNVSQTSILQFSSPRKFDLVLIKGVLIHLAPASLPHAYDVLHSCTQRYLLVCEYYNPTPVEILYRGHAGKLFKRDFCGEILDRHADLQLLDYGFCYRRDPNFPQDDITWFLMERTRA